MTTHPQKYSVLAQEIEFCENNLQYLWMGVMLPNPSSPYQMASAQSFWVKSEIWLDTDKDTFKSISLLSIHRLLLLMVSLTSWQPPTSHHPPKKKRWIRQNGPLKFSLLLFGKTTQQLWQIYVTTLKTLSKPRKIQVKTPWGQKHHNQGPGTPIWTGETLYILVLHFFRPYLGCH